MSERELEWLRRVRDLSQQLGSETDLELLPPRILAAALELTGAERALLVRVEGPNSSGQMGVKVLAARGFHREALDGSGGVVPRTACECVLRENRGFTTRRKADLEVLSDMTSVAALGVRSLAAVPLRLRGATTGVLYLDHRAKGELFAESELPTLQTLATQAALCLELLERPQEVSPEAAQPAHYLIANSPPMQVLLEEVRRASRCREPVLICGEEGTELGLVARELHAQGPDRLSRFRLLSGSSSSALTHQLLGTEASPGYLSEPCTITIDGVEALDLDLQRILARALAEGRYFPPGSNAPLPVRARLVALSHADLVACMSERRVRPELYLRLDVTRLVVPALRQRSADVPALCAQLLEQIGERKLELSPDTMQRLAHYAWPQNVLELEAELRRLVQSAPPTVLPVDLAPRIQSGRGVSSSTSFAGKTLGEIEGALVREAMQQCGGVKAKAARQLGVPRSTLYHLLERHGVS